jgi:hypothetical protein
LDGELSVAVFTPTSRRQHTG